MAVFFAAFFAAFLVSAPAPAATLPKLGGPAQLAGTAFNILNSMGVFASLGIGEDAQLASKLNEIIDQLNAVEGYVMAIDNDIATSTQALVAEDVKGQVRAALPGMVTARGDILQCADTIATLAGKAHTDANDAMLRELALELVGSGTQNGACVAVRSDFSAIHAQIVSDPLLGSSTGIYSLIAQIARPNFPYQNMAEHFVQFELVQREVVELLSNAYTVIGDPATLQHRLTVSPNYLGELRDEEAAFLMATDTYVAASPTTPHDTSPGELADAIVQSFEGTLRQATTYSASIFNDAQTTLAPVLTAPASGATPVAMSDTVAGPSWSYYQKPEMPITTHIEGCDANTGPGIAYLEPASAHGGFYLRYTCTLHVERHLNANLPLGVDGTWMVTGRHGSAALGAPALRNAVTFADETAADGLALAADPAGGKTQFSSLSLVADTTDPTQVTLTVDLPGQAGAGIGTGTTHGLVAGSASPISFSREPGGPADLDQYALKAPAGTYLSIGSDGYATLSTTPSYFDLQTTPDGHEQLVTSDNQVLYVDVQHQQFFHGEVPDDVWANTPNLAATTAVPFWGVPADGVPRQQASASPTGQLYFYPPCLGLQLGEGEFAVESNGQTNTTCSDGIYQGFPLFSTFLTYVIYDATIYNEDTAQHSLLLTIGGAAVGPPPTVSTGATYNGIHCYAPGFDHLDVAGVGTQPSVSTPTGTGGPWAATIPGKSNGVNGSWTMQCQVLDHLAYPSILIINDVDVRPCRDLAANNTCTAFQASP
ncbi:MAG TPA: hypothetical protein VGP64_01305 [Polyangia bacterium]